MRWIITGGAGFLGTNLVQSLSPEEGEVLVIDRFQPRWKVDRPNVRYIEQDVREVESYKHELLPGSVVVHMASNTYPGKAEKAIESDIQDNLLTAVRLANACVDAGVKSFIFLSSGGAIYGDQTTFPIKEDARLSPVSAYGAMKVSVEYYLTVIHHLHGLPTALLRVANPFGQWHRGTGQGAVNVFMKNILDGKTIEIWGAGEQIRDYIPARDVAESIRVVGLGFDAGCEAFNVGTGQGRTLLEILSALEKITGLKPQIIYKPSRGVDVDKNIIDASKIYERFGWKSTTDFETALCETWDWVKRNQI